jgi:hypothetical protein
MRFKMTNSSGVAEYTLLFAFSIICALLSWYGFVSWGYHAGYVSARIGAIPEYALREQRAQGSLMFLMMWVGQMILLGLAALICTRYFRLRSTAVRLISALGLAMILDIVTFSVMFFVQWHFTR